MLAIGLAVWLVPLAAVALAAGSGSVLADEALFFTGACARDVRRGLRRARVREPGGGDPVRLAERVRDGRRPQPRRDHPGPADHGRGVRRASSPPTATRRRSRRWRPGSPARSWSPGPRSSRASCGSSSAPPRSSASAATSGSPGALTAITASVVGVIANLAVVFATSVLFDEVRRPDAVRPRGRGPGPGFGRPAGDRRRRRFVRRDPPLPRQRRLGDRRRRARRSRSCRGRVAVRRRRSRAACRAAAERWGTLGR